MPVFLLWLRSNWKPAMIALLLAAGLAWGAWQGHRASQYRQGLERAQIALQASAAALENASRIRIADDEATNTRVIYVDRVTQKEAIGREATTKALEANRAWADTPVPADVLNSLRD